MNEKLKVIIDYFDKKYPVAETELEYQNPYQLLVSVILSAQCTDKRVNLVTPALFEAFPEVKNLATGSFEVVFPFIKSISYPNSKTKHLISMAQKVVNEHNGEIPTTHKELTGLQGVGRKTANVMMSVLHNEAVMPVDTHVFRVSKRLGLADAKNVLQCERQLVALFPKAILTKAHHWLILHGRYVCVARKPKCTVCGLTKECSFFAQNL